MKRYSQFVLGDMLLTYDTDDRQRVSMGLVPAAMKDRVMEKEYRTEPLVQIHARGDQFPNGYGNGHTLACSPASEALKLVSQRRDGNTVTTTVADESGRTVHHRVRWEEGLKAVIVSCAFENAGEKPVILNLLSSVNLGGITPFTDGDAAGALFLHRIRSMWSAEGRVQTESGSLLTVWAGALDGLGRFFGMDGAILLAFLLGLPANETVLPILLGIYGAAGGEMPEIRAVLLQNGWTSVTALCVLLFTLLHWPCSTTLLTIRRETGSWKWTALAAALPTAMGLALCALTRAGLGQ